MATNSTKTTPPPIAAAASGYRIYSSRAFSYGAAGRRHPRVPWDAVLLASCRYHRLRRRHPSICVVERMAGLRPRPRLPNVTVRLWIEVSLPAPPRLHLHPSATAKLWIAALALLHDIGKISIPDAILNKPASLSNEEYDIIKQHPLQGVHIVESLHSIRETIPLIRWHHERLDGKGCPDGLFGGAIPLLSRILAVAEVFDAVSSDRPYRRGLPRPKCLEILRTSAEEGGLDPELVHIFCESLVMTPARSQGALDETATINS